MGKYRLPLYLVILTHRSSLVYSLAAKKAIRKLDRQAVKSQKTRALSFIHVVRPDKSVI